MYDNNPTLEAVVGLHTTKTHDETRQGEAFFVEGTTADKYFYIESYGCQMNFSDSEIVAAILMESGYAPTRAMEQADLFLINTCSIREKAEDTVRKRLKFFELFKAQKPELLVGVLGCMAERLKTKFLEEERIVDMVVGPDAYRDLPALLHKATDGERGVNVLLSREETYADIAPVRLGSNGVSAFVSIMRGCDNMCSFCVVPFTRGRERSRDPLSIIAEATHLFEQGYREVTLLGQNVDSYKYKTPNPLNPPKGDFLTADELKVPSDEVEPSVINFAQLLEMVAQISPLLRIRFSTSHPKDITDEVLFTMKKYSNICKYIHLPVQSGNSRILELMNRTYDREWYMERVSRIYEIMPECAISADIITGFCSETEEEHQDTLSIMEFAKYTYSFMFFYSERPGTLAARKLKDDISLDVKKRRLNDIIQVQNRLSLTLNQLDIDTLREVLIEGDSKRSANDWCGRDSQNKMCVFPKGNTNFKKGDYVQVRVLSVTQGTLICELEIRA
jgi:tRNA-2-methylthio-N6-dimethylallyladenosine synthase